MYRKMIKDVFYAKMEETEEMGTRRSRIWRKNPQNEIKKLLKLNKKF